MVNNIINGSTLVAEYGKCSSVFSQEEQRIFEDNKEAFLNSFNTLQNIVNREIESFKNIELSKEEKWKQFKKDCLVMSGYRESQKGRELTWPADTCQFDNTLFGPVGIMWNKSSKRCQTIEASIITFDNKEDYYQYIKENRPLLYFIGFSKMDGYKINLYTFQKEKVSEPYDRYLIRHFPELGKLPWWKYQFQFLFNKVNPKWGWLRSLVYRVLVTK